jgi:hypothetical protein
MITTFVELRVVAGRSRMRAGRPHAVSGRPMLIHTCHTMSIPRCAVALRSRFQNGMVVAWHRRGMAYVNQTRPHCVNQMRKTQSKPLAARHGRGTAWARHGNGMGTAWYVCISLNFFCTQAAALWLGILSEHEYSQNTLAVSSGVLTLLSINSKYFSRGALET